MLETIIAMILRMITTFASISLNRKLENKQDRKMYIALMVGGFIWFQLQ